MLEINPQFFAEFASKIVSAFTVYRDWETVKAETIFDANSAKNWNFVSSINDYQNLFNMSKLKQVLFDAFGIQMKAMKVVGADGKELEINKDSGAPAVGEDRKSVV